jgi:predicted esterase
MIELIKTESEILKGKTENIFIGGFSQGCMLSLATFLKLKDEALGGLVCYSGG